VSVGEEMSRRIFGQFCWVHAKCARIQTYTLIPRYERKLMRYLEDLIREMDRKIVKNKERAQKESAPRELRGDDQIKLSEVQGRAKGAIKGAFGTQNTHTHARTRTCTCVHRAN